MAKVYALGLFLLMGCRGPQLAGASPEEAALTSLGLSLADPQRAELSLELLVQNPEARTAELVEVWWELWLSGSFVGAGTHQARIALPANAHSPVRLDLPFTVNGAFEALRGKPCEVGVRGRLVLRHGVQRADLRFQGVRRLLVSGAPAVAR